MPAEDRDRLFERALAQHLRADAGAGNSACLDAEMLAAYYEGVLSEEETSAAKNHLVSCPRCREIVAQLAAAQSVSELRNQEDELVTTALLRPKNDEVYEEASAPGVSSRAAKETESRVGHFPSKKKWLLRWAAPAAAIAAGVLLYVGARDFRSQTKRTEPATQIAENRGDNALARDSYAAPGVPQEMPQTPPQAMPKQKDDDLAGRVSRRQTAGNPTPSVLLDELESLRGKAEPPKDSKAEKKSAPPMKLATPMIGGNANTAQSGGRISASEPSKNLAKAKSFDAADKSDTGGALQNGADAQQNQIQLQASGAATGAPAASPSSPAPSPAPPASASPQITVTAAATQAATETVEVTSAPREKEANLPAMSRNEMSILGLAPSGMTAQNGNSIWRFGEHGAIAHSGDGGKTWKPQVAAVAATLTSGSAPAKNICWIAGAAGTLLRTTDGGKHWQLIITPIAGDLGGVLASDGKHANIWDAAHRETYQSSNGGKTWEKKTAN
jgi:Photosynthesis system II assembly factor YCF48/Putative zinc-finger